MTPYQVKYHFPTGNPAPFDLYFEGHFFISARGLSNLSADLNDFSIDRLSENVPMGYKTIIVSKRMLLLQRGDTIKTWEQPSIDKGKIKPHYYALSNQEYTYFDESWQQEVQTDHIYKPSAQDQSLDALQWNDFKACHQYSKAHSEQYQDWVLISKIIDVIPWH